MENEIKKIILEVIREKTESIENIKDLEHINELNFSAYINSIVFIKMLVKAEKVYNISFSDKELDIRNIKSINDIVTIIKNKLGEG